MLIGSQLHIGRQWQADTHLIQQGHPLENNTVLLQILNSSPAGRLRNETWSEHQTRCEAQALLLSDTLKQAEMQLKSRKSGEASWVDIPDCYDTLRWFVLPQELAAELRIKVAGQ